LINLFVTGVGNVRLPHMWEDVKLNHMCNIRTDDLSDFIRSFNETELPDELITQLSMYLGFLNEPPKIKDISGVVRGGLIEYFLKPDLSDCTFGQWVDFMTYETISKYNNTETPETIGLDVANGLIGLLTMKPYREQWTEPRAELFKELDAIQAVSALKYYGDAKNIVFKHFPALFNGSSGGGGQNVLEKLGWLPQSLHFYNVDCKSSFNVSYWKDIPLYEALRYLEILKVQQEQDNERYKNG